MLAFYPFILVSFLIIFFGILRWIVQVILKFRHGADFWGLLDGVNAFMSLEDVSHNIVNSILVVESNNVCSFIDSVKEVFKATHFNGTEECSKIATGRRWFLGYPYLLRNQCTLEDCFNIINVDDEVIDKKDLEAILSTYSNKPLPKNNTAMIQYLVFNKPIRWKSRESGNSHFALCLRTHHSLGDGINLLNWIFDIAAVGGFYPTPSNPVIHRKKSNPFWRKLIGSVGFFFVDIPMIMKDMTTKANDRSILHGPALSGEKITAFYVEEEAKLVVLVKTVKNRIPHTKFSDVVLAAVAASFSDYLHKICGEIPGSMMASLMAMRRSPKSATTVLENNFAFDQLQLPLESLPLLTRLERIKATRNQQNHSGQHVYYWLMKIFGTLFPKPILTRLCCLEDATIDVSNLPGPGRVDAFNGQLRDVIILGPNRKKTGIVLLLLTYDDRFQIGLTVDKALIQESEDANEILNGIVKNIVKLHASVQ